MRNLQILVVFFILCGFSAFAQQKLKVACVGNSITENWGVPIGEKYPDVLQKLLGEKCEVRNFGKSGRTMLKNGDFPYWNESHYRDVLSWNPDIVIIKLGTNDSKPQNWAHKSEFESDYRQFIASIKKLSVKPTIYLCLPVPVFEDKWGITQSVVKNEIEPMIRVIAKKEKLKIVDLYTPMVGKQDCFPDGVHPNAEGCRIMAETVYGTIAKTANKRIKKIK